jgi:NAD+ synthetase
LKKVTIDFSDIASGLPAEASAKAGEFARTYDIDKRMKEKYGDNIWHAVGMDLVSGGAEEQSEIQLHWERGQELWQNCNFVVMTREKGIYNKKDFPPHAELLDLDFFGSSTEIRRRIKDGQPIRELVLPEVEIYIEKNRLYREAPQQRNNGGRGMYKLTDDECDQSIVKASTYAFDYCRRNNINYLVTGSSGGLDSAVTLALAEQAVRIAKDNGYPLTSVGLIMPCNSKPDAERLGRLAIKKFNAEELMIDFSCLFSMITGEYSNASRATIVPNLDQQIRFLLERTGGEKALRNFDFSKKVAQGNIKARLRMMLGTYHVARMLEGMVLSTDNLSEFWMAFWTINGDVGDYGMIQKVMKGLELYDIARRLGVPQEIIDSRPDDGNGVAGTDEDQLGANYRTVDTVMVRLIQQGFNPDGSCLQLDSLPLVEGVSVEVVKKLAERALRGAYKRRGTLNLTREELGLPGIMEIVL